MPHPVHHHALGKPRELPLNAAKRSGGKKQDCSYMLREGLSTYLYKGPLNVVVEVLGGYAPEEYHHGTDIAALSG
jgi:hypothetical protein